MALFKSVKFWTAVGGVLAVVFSQLFGIAEDEINKVVAILVAFILGRGLEDIAKKAK